MRYPRRLSTIDIRLLVILPASDPAEPLVCQLEDATVDAAPSYEALSYVWGDPAKRIGFECNGTYFSCTSNLHRALIRIRLQDVPRVVWADAICINQEDLSERSHQVILMGRIYSQAERVIVWLGHEFEESAVLAQSALTLIFNACMALEEQWKEALEDKSLFQQILERFTADERAHIQRTDYFDNDDPPYKGTFTGWHLYRGVPTPAGVDISAWNALRHLYGAPWFRRTWCIQEVRLSRSVICYWGHQELLWCQIGITAAWLEDCHARLDFAPNTLPSEIDYELASHMYDMQWERQPLLETLSYYKDALATDPRDKVYGLLGLVQAGQARDSIVIDYESPAKRVYADTALAIIRAELNLDVLAYVDHEDGYTGIDDTYSWAPDWTRNNRTMPHTLDRWQGSTERAIRGSFAAHTDNLRLQGLPFGCVTSVDGLLDDLAMRDSPIAGSTNPILSLWNKALSPENAAGSSFDHFGCIVDMARTLAGDDGFGSHNSYEDISQQCFNYLAMIDHLSKLTGQTNTTAYDPLSLAVEAADRFAFEKRMWRFCD